MTTENPTVHIPRQRQSVEIFPMVMDKTITNFDGPLTDFRPQVLPADYELEVGLVDEVPVEPEGEEEVDKKDPKDSSVQEPAASSDSEPKIEPTLPETPVPPPAAKANTLRKVPSPGKQAS